MPDKDPIKKTIKKIKTGYKTTKLALTPVKKSPDERLGALFRAAQLNNIHGDGKTFVDLVPNADLRKIVKAYEREAIEPGFNLQVFIAQHFREYRSSTEEAATLDTSDPEQYIHDLWDSLTRQADTVAGSLFPLPHPYIVPGGRFQEQFYWDSYFVMLGLEAQGRHDLTDGIMANFVHMFRKFGFIPTGNRTYFTSRSQPPYFLQMTRLIAHRKGHYRYLLTQLPYLVMEHNFWTRDTREFMNMSLSRKRYKRIVRMPNGATLSRYYDANDTPRPEMYKDDIETTQKSDRDPKHVNRHLRAAAESGWDFSSRWFTDPQDLSTIHTTDIVPIDLNCLLYELEMALAEAYKKLLQYPLARFYRKRAERRQVTINEYLWDEKAGYFFDYDSKVEQRTNCWSLAGMYPLYCGLATPEQAARVAENVKKHFLKAGGVVTTTTDNGEQWDAPNGWAPLQWVTIMGLRRYGYDKLADTIKFRWCGANLALFQTEHKFVEKYNVVDPAAKGGGGEYTLQDGFGWTNGVFAALKTDLDMKLSVKK